MFVLGGGLAVGAHLYLAPIQRWFGELLYAPDLRPHPELSFAELGERAGAIGAALLAADRLWTIGLTRSVVPPVVRRHVVGAGLVDLAPGRPRGRRCRASTTYLPGSSALYTSKKCWISATSCGVRSAMSWTSSQRGSPRRHADDLGVLAGLVLHVQHADRPGLDPHARVHRVLEQHQRVERIAVAAQRVGDEPVVGRIRRGREQPPVEEDPARRRGRSRTCCGCRAGSRSPRGCSPAWAPWSSSHRSIRRASTLTRRRRADR